MSKKPRKIEEYSTSYSAKKPVKTERAASSEATGGARYMDDAVFKKSANHVFKVHEELFRKLAK
jgi:hypothetical protein